MRLEKLSDKGSEGGQTIGLECIPYNFSIADFLEVGDGIPH